MNMTDHSMEIRLQKHIANLGICSRRKAEEYIKLGRIKLNGKIVTEMGVKVNPATDKVVVVGIDNQVKIEANAEKIYVAINKPIDYITSTSSEQGASVLELLTTENNVGRNKKEIKERLYPVGRLDKDSEGLVLLTNDGDLTNTLTHPKFEHEKEYEITIDKPLNKDARKILTMGMIIDEDMVKGIKIVEEINKGKRTIVTIILEEGKNRQIRKMFGLIGYRITSLKRIRIGKLKLGILPVGKWKLVTKDSIL